MPPSTSGPVSSKRASRSSATRRRRSRRCASPPGGYSTTRAAAGRFSSRQTAARRYYRYGDALLRKVEESDDLFGGSDAAGAGASGDDGDDDLGADDEPPAENEDLALAWDMIEVSRSLFEADGLLAQEGLATALLRLGDLQKLNGNLGAAIGDYEKCLAIRREAYDGSDRRVADVEWCLAVGFEYAAAEKECSDPAPLRAKALMHYEACRASLAARRGRIAAAFDAGNAVQGDAAEADDLKEIVDELDETISACVERDAADAVNAVLPRAPATTVGFATPAARADDAAPVATLQAKKKRLRDAPAETGKPDRTKPFANNAH